MNYNAEPVRNFKIKGEGNGNEHDYETGVRR